MQKLELNMEKMWMSRQPSGEALKLKARGLGDSNKTKLVLAQILNEELGGATRIPALLFGNESVTVESVNLQSCKTLHFEALHCSMNHMKNTLEE